MRVDGKPLTRTVRIIVATLLITSAATACKKTPNQGNDSSRPSEPVASGPGDGEKAGQSGPTTIPEKCSENTGANDHPPSLKEPTTGGDFSNYRNNHCFSPAKGWSHLKNRNPGAVPMWIMPELRMRQSDPKRDAAPGEGLVVAKVRNNHSSNKYHDDGTWVQGQDLLPGHESLIWLSQDTKKSVLFTYDNQNHIVILASGKWIPMTVNTSNPNPNHAEALWDHPDTRQPGTGWVTCLDGCCTPNGIFSIQ
jgi:hypothetical protein